MQTIELPPSYICKLANVMSFLDMKSVNCSKPGYTGYTSITCWKFSNITYNLIFATKFNDSSILSTIISCDYLNLLWANEYVDDVTILNHVIKYKKNSPGGSANQIAVFKSN